MRGKDERRLNIMIQRCGPSTTPASILTPATTSSSAPSLTTTISTSAAFLNSSRPTTASPCRQGFLVLIERLWSSLDSNRAIFKQSHKRPKLMAQKSRILYPAREIPKKMPVLESNVLLIEPREVEMREPETLEEVLKRKQRISKAQPHDIKIRIEILDLEDQIGKKKASYYTTQERKQVSKTHKIKMVELWRKAAQDFGHDLEVVKEYLRLWTATCQEPEKILEYVSQKADFFKQNVDFWRFVTRDVYSKVATDVPQYVHLIDQVTERFKTAQPLDEKFIAEMILLRTRVYFESGNLPTVIATIQLLVELFCTSSEVALREKLFSIPQVIHGLIAVFWNSGFRRFADVYKNEIRPIFPDSEIGFHSFLKLYLEKCKGNPSVVNQQLANAEAARKYLDKLNNTILEQTIQHTLKVYPKGCPKSNVWIGVEKIRQKHLWFPIVAYAGVEPTPMMNTAFVPYERIANVVYLYSNKSIGVQLILSILGLFGVAVPSASTNEDNVLTRFGFLEPPTVHSELENFDAWAKYLLRALSDMQSGGSKDYKYAYAMMMAEEMSSFKELTNFLAQTDTADKDVVANVAFDTVLHQMASMPNSAAFLPTKNDTYRILSNLYEKLGSGLICFDDKGNAASIFAFRVLAKLLVFCPNDQKIYKRFLTTRGELYKKFLGHDVMAKLTAAHKNPHYDVMAKELERLFQQAIKVPKTDHFCGHPATYIAFYRAAIEYHGKSLSAFLAMVKKLGDQYPQFCLNQQWCVLVMQYLWNREKTAEDFEKERKMSSEDKVKRMEVERKELEAKVKLNRYYLDLHPTNVELMKLLANHFYVNHVDRKEMRLRTMFEEEKKDPFVNLVRCCANIYLSNLQAKTLCLNVSELPTQCALTRDQLIKARDFSFTCSISSSFAQTWLQFEKSVFGTASLEKVIQDRKFSKALLVDHLKMDTSFYATALATIYDNNKLFAYTTAKEAGVIWNRCQGTKPYEWTWKLPLSRHIFVERRVNKLVPKDEVP
ncbi:hypothetical protein L596_000815 [Steinernema carpocapsae]|uniref:Uncharacterized protein n=1 Tax=Steinernema carpocapsae TaxID=34508 RepID=A0A4U8UK00_STECR|nr:hypothetical protein L596_000815 [Steinernema carpocapsae]